MSGSITLSPDMMEKLVAKAFVDGLTQEQKEALVQQSIAAVLMKAPDSGFNRDRRSEFQRAFDSAVLECARRVAYDLVQGDEKFLGGIKALFADAAEKLFATGEARDQIVSWLAETLGKAIKGDRY